MSSLDSPLFKRVALPPIASHPKLHGARNVFKENGEPIIIFEKAPKNANGEDDGVYLMRFNRLKAFNGFNDAMYLVFADILNEAEKNDDVKIIILTGNGDSFSSGKFWK